MAVYSGRLEVLSEYLSKQDCFAKRALTLVRDVGFAGFCVLTWVGMGSSVTPTVGLMAVDLDRLISAVRSRYLKLLERNQDYKSEEDRNRKYLSVLREPQLSLLVPLLFSATVVEKVFELR